MAEEKGECQVCGKLVDLVVVDGDLEKKVVKYHDDIPPCRQVCRGSHWPPKEVKDG